MNFYNNTVDINDIWYESHRSIIERVAIDCEAGDRVDELVEKFLDKPLKIKKRRDPRIPKRPMTSFMFFCNEFRNQIWAENPEFKMGDVAKELGKRWKQLSEVQKEKYSKMNEVDKERYEEEYETYLENKAY